MRAPYPVPPEPPGGRKNASSSGPLAQAPVRGKTEFDELIQHIDHMETLGVVRDEAKEKAVEGKKVLQAADKRLDKALAGLGVHDVEPAASSQTQPSPPSPVRGVVGNSPALSVNTILGIVFGIITLLGLTLNSDQHAAVIAIVTGFFVLLPIVAGVIIKAINTRRANNTEDVTNIRRAA